MRTLEDEIIEVKRILRLLSDHNILWGELVTKIGELYGVDAWAIVHEKGYSYYTRINDSIIGEKT